jgi:type IV secretion system protein VirD4
MNTDQQLPHAQAAGAHPFETLAFWLLGGLVGVGALLWLTGELAGRLFHGAWPPVTASQIASVVVRFPHHLADPAHAWPVRARHEIPGPAAFYGTLAALLLPSVLAAAWLLMRRSGHRDDPRSARWARTDDLRLLRTRHHTGRLTLGRVDGRLVAAEARQSVIVVGPTQTGKTTGFAIPAILEWEGPVVATSVKTDLLNETLAARQSLPGANAWIYDPTWSTGHPGARWTPLSRCLTWQGAQQVADWLVRAARPSGSTLADADFWSSAAAILLAPILLSAACSGGTMWEVVSWVDMQETDKVRFALEANDELEALTALDAPTRWDERTKGSVYATAQTILNAYHDPGVLASAMGADLRAQYLLDGGQHTAYLCAPAHEQRRLQPLFATLIQEIVAAVYERATETGKPLDPPLLLVLDECANIAPLREIATLAATGAGQGIQLVSVFQDLAQINAVYGREHAPTIVSNHRAKIVLSGIADPHTLGYLARLIGHEQVRDHTASVDADGRRSTSEQISYRGLAPEHLLRQMQPGHGILVYGHLPPTQITLRPWFKERRLRRLANQHRLRPEDALT